MFTSFGESGSRPLFRKCTEKALMSRLHGRRHGRGVSSVGSPLRVQLPSPHCPYRFILSLSDFKRVSVCLSSLQLS